MLLPLPTLAALFLFGSVVVSYALYWGYRKFKPSAPSNQVLNPRSEGLVEGEHSVAQLGRAGFELGMLLLFTWVCENRPVFPHGDKIHDFDFFYLIVFGLMAVAVIFTVHKSPQPEVGILSREQTEEWKGVMQLIFLLYHQFALEETYPLIRLFISCYVFLTGFGNTSFFYTKRDYSLVRVLSMLWRLLFACLVLAMTHDNPIILYYIVPLHTFYFFVSYVTMVVWERKVNYTKHGLKLKLGILSMIIFAVWEFPQVFDVVFFFLSDKPNPGAAVGASGTRYEWQFRSGLDHYSSLFGMMFACAFPMMEQRINNGLQDGNRLVRLSVSAVMISFVLYWALALFPQNKYVYNAQHAYVFVFPMCAYLFLRNCHPYLRRVHLGLFATAGKYTLETYLLQHHIWLTSNAKTVLVLLPGFPKLNFLLVSGLYFLLSVKLFDLTVKLKLLLIPSNNVPNALRGLTFVAGAVGASFCLAWGARQVDSYWLNMSVVFLGAGVWLALAAGHSVTVRLEKAWLLLSIVLATTGLVVALMRGEEGQQLGVFCDANQGNWVEELPNLCKESPGSHYAYCESRAWTWDVMAQKQCAWKRVGNLDGFDQVVVVSSPTSSSWIELALALARVENPKFDSKALPSKSKIKFVVGFPIATTISAQTLILCNHEDTYDECAKLENGVVLLVKNEALDTAELQTKLFVVDAHAIKTLASPQDKLSDQGDFRAHVYNVIAQVALNQAKHIIKSQAPLQPPSKPTGAGLAHNPVYGALFLVVATFGLWMGDGYLGLVATFGKVFGTKEQQVIWEQAVEKVHQGIPGLGENEAVTSPQPSTPVTKRTKGAVHLSDVEEAVELTKA